MRSRSPSPAHRAFPALLLLATACATPPPQAERDLAAPIIERGKLVAGRIVGGSLASPAADRYLVDLAAGDALLLEVDQAEIDVVVRLSAPGGREVLPFDSPTGTLTLERVCFIAEETGIHAIDVAPFDAAGAYALHLVDTRPATASDRQCAAGAAAFRAAEKATQVTEEIAHREQAGRLWEEAGEPLLAAIAWRQAGWLQRHQGATAVAVADLERARAQVRRSGPPRLEVSILSRLGLAYRDAGDLLAAAEVLDQALALARAADDPRGMAAAWTNLGLIDEEMGEPHRAVDRYREALEIWRREDDPGETAQALDNLARVLGVLDHHDEALDALDEALALARRSGDRERQANALAASGWVHHLRGEPARGLPPLREARDLRRQAGDAKGEAGVLDRLGTVLAAAGDPHAAEEAYRSSLAISERMDLPTYRAATRNNLGCLLAETGRAREAARFLDRALTYFEESQDPKSWAQTEYCLALLARHRGDGVAALAHIRRALTIVESLREKARLAGHRYRPIWLWQDYAELEVELLLDRARALDDPQARAEAFAAADRMRARTLYELVVRTRGGAEQAAGRALAARAEQLQAELNARAAERAARLATAGPEPSAPRLEAEIRRLRLDLEHARAEMRAAARRSGQLGMPRPVSAAEAQQLLDRRTVLLTYVLGARRSHLLVLTRDHLQAVDLAPRKVLEDHAEALYHALKESRHWKGQWRHASSALGRLLLPPEAIPPGAERLLVVPDGALHYVPFAVLGSPRQPPREAADRLVLDDFEVVTVPSAAVLAALRARRQDRPPAAKTIALFADPVFSPEDPRIMGVAASLPPQQPGGHDSATPADGEAIHAIEVERLPEGPLPRLPATAAEAAAILARVPADRQLALLGPQASKQAILSADLRPYRILHFATHAWIDERFPELSGLVLSTVDPAGREIDGALYLHEIDRLDLAADLTVLSGCQTALGRRVRGDGLLGLTQGFFHAGSSQVLVSLWSLHDSAAARLMDELYRRLLEQGEPPATALRHAQQWLRRQEPFRAPRYWAPFVLQGDG